MGIAGDDDAILTLIQVYFKVLICGKESAYINVASILCGSLMVIITPFASADVSHTTFGCKTWQ